MRGRKERGRESDLLQPGPLNGAPSSTRFPPPFRSSSLSPKRNAFFPSPFEHQVDMAEGSVRARTPAAAAAGKAPEVYFCGGRFPLKRSSRPGCTTPDPPSTRRGPTRKAGKGWWCRRLLRLRKIEKEEPPPPPLRRSGMGGWMGESRFPLSARHA